MERPGDGRQEPSDPLPLSHTAFDLDATSDDLLSLYIRAGDSHRRSWQNQPLQATEQDLTLRLRDEVIRRLTTEQPESSSLQFDHYDTSTSESMSAKNKSQQQQYQLKSTDAPADQAKSLSQNNKDQLINSLRTHKVNTITELRRIEKIFAYLDSEEVTEPMTSAWAYYVNSNNLLNELRNLTKRIPFSSECVDEAKALVVADPASVRSWNFCWLVLVKIEKDNLILKHARALASKRSTWGDRQPTAEDARKFITACVAEWTSALRQLLQHWDAAPSTTGN